MSLSRLTSVPGFDRIDPVAFKVALRTAIFMPLTFALATLLLGEAATPFAAFGSFIILAMVTFAGRPWPRFWAWLGLILAGCVLIAAGTFLSTRVTVIGVLVAGVVSFLIFFLGVVNPYIAAARNGAVLLLALPLMIPATTSTIDERLSGWLLAVVVCVPATYLLWRLPWTGELRRHAAGVCASLAALVRDPDSDSLREEVRGRVWSLRHRFLATPHRPTGATGVSAAIASLVEELGWLFGLVTIPGAGIDADGEHAKRLRVAVADLLETSARALGGEKVPIPTDPVTSALEGLVENSATELVKADRDGIDAEARQLEHEFRLRKVAYAALDVSRMVEVATEREKAPGVLGRVWAWFSVRSRRQVRETGRIVTEHSALSSSWFQNSIRGAIGIALAVWMADLLSVQNAFWVVLGTLSVLRNNALGTRGSVARALAGTLIGIVIGTGIIALIGDSTVLLWIALPLSVLFAAYAPRALSLAAGQAGFAVLVMVLYNLIEPVGWQVAIIRIQDVAVGCGVSLIVGLLIWPRGATALIRHALAESLRAGSALVGNRGLGVLAGHAATQGPDWEASRAASDRLDVALRQYLDETAGELVDPEALMALSAAGLRLRRVAVGLGQIPDEPWYEVPGRGSSPKLEAMIDEVAGWYGQVGDAIDHKEPPPAPIAVDPEIPHQLIGRLESGGTGPDSQGAGIARIWIFENFAYLSELSVRFNQHARDLFSVRKEEATGQSG